MKDAKRFSAPLHASEAAESNRSTAYLPLAKKLSKDLRSSRQGASLGTCLSSRASRVHNLSGREGIYHIAVTGNMDWGFVSTVTARERDRDGADVRVEHVAAGLATDF